MSPGNVSCPSHTGRRLEKKKNIVMVVQQSTNWRSITHTFLAAGIFKKTEGKAWSLTKLHCREQKNKSPIHLSVNCSLTFLSRPYHNNTLSFFQCFKAFSPSFCFVLDGRVTGEVRARDSDGVLRRRFFLFFFKCLFYNSESEIAFHRTYCELCELVHLKPSRKSFREYRSFIRDITTDAKKIRKHSPECDPFSLQSRSLTDLSHEQPQFCESESL